MACRPWSPSSWLLLLAEATRRRTQRGSRLGRRSTDMLVSSLPSSGELLILSLLRGEEGEQGRAVLLRMSGVRSEDLEEGRRREETLICE